MFLRTYARYMQLRLTELSRARWLRKLGHAYRFRPRIYGLEDRTLLSTVFWSNPTGGDWDTPTNWTDDQEVHRLPGPADDVVISGVNSGATITHSSDDVISTLTSNNAGPYNLSLRNNPLVLAGTSPSLLDDNTHVVFGGGTPLEIGSGLTVEGPVDFGNSCSISSLEGTRSVLEPPWFLLEDIHTSIEVIKLELEHIYMYLGRQIRAASLEIQNGAELDLIDGSSLTIRDGSSLLISGTGMIFSNNGTGGMIKVDKGGLFEKGSGTGTANVSLPLDNNGTVDLEGGTLDLSAGGRSRGSFTVQKGATLQFGSSTQVLKPGSSISGAGSVMVSGGVVEIRGSYNVSGNTTVSGGTARFLGNVGVLSTFYLNGDATAYFSRNDVSVVNAVISGGTLQGLGEFNVSNQLMWTGGTMAGSGSTTVADTLDIGGNTSKVLDNRTLNNDHIATWTGTANLYLRSGAVLNNQPGAIFSVETDQNFVSGANPPGIIKNAGIFQKRGTTGTTELDVDFANSDTGTVDVQSGTLTLNVGGEEHGAFMVEAGATLDFGSGTHTFHADSSISGDGDLAVSGSAQAAGRTEVNGSFTITGTTRVLANSTLEVTHFSNGASTGAFVNAGTVVLGATLTVGGNFTNESAGAVNIDINGTDPATDYGQLIVSGTVTLNGGTMNVNFQDNYVPTDGDTFIVLTSQQGVINGDFAVYHVTGLDPNFQMTHAIDGGNLDLTVSLANDAPGVPADMGRHGVPPTLGKPFPLIDTFFQVAQRWEWDGLGLEMLG